MIAKKSVIKINDIMMYLAVAMQHLRLMALLICFSLMVGLVYYEFSRPVYEAKCLVHLKVFPEPLSAESIFRDGSRAAVQIQLTSPHIIERTAKRLGVNASEREIMKKYVKKLTVDPNSEGNLIIGVWPFSYEWARDWTKTSIEEYLSYREEKRRETIQRTFATYNADMEIARKNIDEIFKIKHGFRETNELMKVRITLDNLREVPIKLAVAKHRLSLMDEIRADFKDRDVVERFSALARLKQDKAYAYSDFQLQLGRMVNEGSTATPQNIIVMPENLPRNEKDWELAERHAREIKNKIAELSITFKPGNHKIRVLQKELDAINKSLELDFEVAQKNFELEYKHVQQEQKELEAKIPLFEETLQRYAKLEGDLNAFDAGQLGWRTMLTDMTKRLNVIDFGADKDRMLIEYIGPVEPIRDLPIAPNRLRILMSSLVLGLALAIAIPFMIAYLDNSVTDVEHVEESLRIRGLGVVPRVEEGAINNLLSSGLNAKPSAKPEYHLQENFRIIRTNLIMHAESPNQPQVILVSSAMPQEGKTVVAANLAMSFATKGEKTLLIDGDLRRGRLHRLFGCQNKPGLSDVLSQYNTLADACRPSGNENLTIMTCGKHLNWASELLDTPGFIKLMEELRSQYQRIIIDTPPVLGLSETSIMQRMADSVLMVIWSGHTQMPNIKDAITTLQTNGAKFSGFVLNRLDFSAFTNRYKYFYYSPRYYTNYKAIESSAVTDQIQG